ncbi:hypothetical protein NKR23_g6170 [Pleurostoma richardsiae]|uniref:Uncharacterized protein n=1 Tax=Pleurostoma richardsiae TaxID=41990 RepID=A0AA38RF00_9PEZI|nr:hypothetical protein NKR23_g6170 [Pleurostoma richardsiae]
MTDSLRKKQTRYILQNTVPAEGSREAKEYELNQRVSPLLRIPAELRLRVYDLVLGHRQIYIYYVPWQHKRRVKNGQPYHETIRGGFRCKILYPTQNPWEEPDRWYLKPFLDVRMTLLSGVCRQLYHETALLPHKLNPWSFQNTYVMERYIMTEGRMTLAQRRTIHTLYCRENLSKAMEKKFGNLKVIVWKDGKKLRRQDLAEEPQVTRRSKASWRDRTYQW